MQLPIDMSKPTLQVYEEVRRQAKELAAKNGKKMIDVSSIMMMQAIRQLEREPEQWQPLIDACGKEDSK